MAPVKAMITLVNCMVWAKEAERAVILVPSMTARSRGMIMGKERMGKRVPFILALATIAPMIVTPVVMPVSPKKITMTK
jgi:hypothetical protein